MEALHQPGDIIDQRYRILDILGKGGIGTTYAAQNIQTGEQVALKAVSLRGTNDPKILELFEREARILSQLNHPGIPRYLDYFQVNKRRNSYFYLAQQLVEGKSLFELVENGWHPQEVEVWHIAQQILEILVYLQQFTPPVIHRDIKPQNILRRSDGKVFLVDFGAVQDVYHSTLTGGSTVAGTYGYMAPEQFRGKTVLATDLYGLGATLIFLLTQKVPADLPKRKLKLDFRPHVQVTKRFADWLDRMIEPVAEDRFPSAGEALIVWQGKTDGKQLGLAKQGNAKTIVTRLNQHFQAQNISVKAGIKNSCLMVLLESEEVPAQQASIAFIREEVVNWELEPLHSVKVYGRRKGEDHPAWRCEFNLMSPTQSTLPPDWTIRKATSMDRFKIIKLLLRRDILNFSYKDFINAYYKILLLSFILGFGIFWMSLLLFFPVILSEPALILREIGLDLSLIIFLVVIPLIWLVIEYGFYVFGVKTLFKLVKFFIFNRNDMSNYWVIERNGQLVAVGEIGGLDGYSYIKKCFVVPAWRKNGLDSALIQCILQEYPKPIYLHCLPNMVDFYMHLGFVQSHASDRNLLQKMVYEDELKTESKETFTFIKKQLSVINQENNQLFKNKLFKHFNSQKINVKFINKNGCLMILLESTKLPNKYISLAVIRKNLKNLGVESISMYSVKVQGRRKGEDHQCCWKHEFEIVEQKELSLPGGCNVRKANLQDKTKLWKFEFIESQLKLFKQLFLFSIAIIILLLIDIGFESTKGDKEHLVFYIKISILWISLLLSAVINIVIQIHGFLFNFIFKFNQCIEGLYIIEFQENIIASAKLRELERKSYIEQLYVAKAWRKKSLDSALVKHLIQESNQPLYVNCHKNFINFYSRLGFIQPGTPSPWGGITTMVYLRNNNFRVLRK